MSDTVLLSAIIFLPVLGALIISFMNRDTVEEMRFVSLGTTIVTFMLTVYLYLTFDPAIGEMQMVVSKEWIGTWNIFYKLGVDGISLPLVLLTSLTSMLAMAASWTITKQVKGYLILFLLLVSGMLSSCSTCSGKSCCCRCTS